MNIEDLKGLMDGFDPASLLPELDSILGVITYAVRIAVLLGPIALLALGLGYLIFAPREANYIFGYRCTFGMGSVEAWRFTQRLAGIVWGVLGLVLTLVMVSLTGKFAGLDVAEALGLATKYVLWEAVLALVSSLVINTVVMIRFTYDGEYRRERAGK